MPSSDVLARLEPIFRDIFDEFDGPVTADLNAKAVAQWDSLANIQFGVMIENAFGIRFTTGEIAAMENVGELSQLVAGKLAAKG